MYVVRMSSSIDIFASKERPKKLIFRNEKGEEFFFLCKQEKKGDLRKEKHLQLNTFVSVWLSCDGVTLARLSHSSLFIFHHFISFS